MKFMHAEELATSLLIWYDQGDLTYQNHESDNSILSCRTAGEVFDYLDNEGLIYLGVTNCFSYKRDLKQDWAFVFKTSDDDVRWIHIMSLNIFYWMENQLATEMSRDKAYFRADELFDRFLKENQ